MRLAPVLLLTVMALGCGDDGTTSEAGDPLDPSLVGRWENSSGRPGFSSMVYSHLKADGTFEYSGLAMVRSPNVRPAETGKTRGRWKAEGGRLYSKADGTDRWIDVGRYEISGNSMILYGPGGATTYWER